ncbi:MAG: LPS assembly protein LptD [Planctomycetota bacterium]
MTLAAALCPTATHAGVTPDALSPLANPVLDFDATLGARRVTVWSQDGARWLDLQGDATVAAGPYAFTGPRAIARIDVQRVPGRTVYHLAVYLVDARPIGDSSVKASAPRLLVTASTTGRVDLEADALDPATTPPPSDALVDDARARIDRRYAALNAEVIPAPTEPIVSPETLARRDVDRAALELLQASTRLAELRAAQLRAVPEREARQLEAAQRRVDERYARRLAEQAAADAGDEAAAESLGPTPQAPELARGAATEPTVLPATGQVNVAADRIVVQPADAVSIPGQSPDVEDLTAVMLIGDVRLGYFNDGQAPLTLQAERAVLFVAGDAGAFASAGAAEADSVRGVYLEDAVVITAGDYTVRAPRAYYDLATNRAVMLDAVLYAYNTELRVPLYMRAQTLRQTSEASFEADRALMTTSEFGVPHFAMGAGRLRVEETDATDGESVQAFVIDDATLRYQNVPFFYWPKLAGRNAEVPLRAISPGYSNDDGPRILTTWDAFGLIGREQPSGADLELELDYTGEHGPAVGFGLEYDRGSYFGEGFVYSHLYDTGDDDLRGRRDIERDGADFRYAGRIQHRQIFTEGLELSLEAASVSDETFLDIFSEAQTETVKQYETSAYLKQFGDDYAASLLVAGNIDDFTQQINTLQTPGYTTAKLPEAELFLPGLSLFSDYITLSSQTTVSNNQLQFGEDDPARRGFSPNATAAVFGFADRNPNTDFDTRFEDRGLPDDQVLRFDTRQEIGVPLSLGPIRVVPYGVGRFTAYETDFEAFSGDDQSNRLWGEAGVRLSTTFAKSYDAHSRVLNLRGLRHVIEPEVYASWAESTLDPDDLPIFDFDTEPLSQGGKLTYGATQRFQTLRGGYGRWRSVDWITLETRYTHTENEEGGPGTGAVPAFVDYRPEYSIGGDHFYSELLVAVSESVALTGDVTFDGDFQNAARWNVGVSVQHTPNLITFLGYRETPILDERLLNYGLTYQITTKYRVGVSQTLDLEREDSRTVSGFIERKLPRWTFRLAATFDTIDDTQSFGFVLLPDGVTGISPVGFSAGQRGNN